MHLSQICGKYATFSMNIESNHTVCKNFARVVSREQAQTAKLITAPPPPPPQHILMKTKAACSSFWHDRLL